MVDPGPRCGVDPQGYFVGALSVSQGHPDRPGMRRLHHDVNHLQKLKKLCIVFFSEFFNFSTLTLTFYFQYFERPFKNELLISRN